MSDLSGKVAIVTGTSRGVGVGISRKLLAAGATVIGCSRRPLDALPAAAGVERSGGIDENDSTAFSCSSPPQYSR